MLVPRSVLAARKCGDVNSSRYALGGLCLTRDAETNQPFAIATDGGKLVAMAWREPDAAEFPADIDLTHRPGCQFTIPTAALDNRPIGRRTRRATEPAATPSPPTLAEVLAATAGSDEPEADEPPAPEWLTTARELVAAGSGDYRAHDGASY